MRISINATIHALHTHKFIDFDFLLTRSYNVSRWENNAK